MMQPLARRLRAVALPLALALLPGACSALCGAEEERTVVVQSDRSVTVTRGPGGAGQPMALEGTSHAGAGQQAFEDTWAAVTRGASLGGGVAITASTVRMPSDTSTLLVAVALVLPTPLREGARYSVGGTFAPPSATDMPMYWSVWGSRPLPGANQAAVSLRSFNYLSVGMQTLNNFIATGATGTVEVTDRFDEGFSLLVDITTTDGSGRTVRIQGPLRVEGQRYTPPCT